MRDLPLQWQPMRQSDLAAVAALSVRMHPDYPERRTVLAEKLRLFANGCFTLSGPSGLCGYCFSHPWTAGPPPALDSLLEALPQRRDCYFIHDLTLDPAAQGRGCAAALVPRLIECARKSALPRMALVAVNRSEPFWRRMGFDRTADAQVQQATRAKYGESAVHMQREME